MCFKDSIIISQGHHIKDINNNIYKVTKIDSKYIELNYVKVSRDKFKKLFNINHIVIY